MNERPPVDSDCRRSFQLLPVRARESFQSINEPARGAWRDMEVKSFSYHWNCIRIDVKMLRAAMAPNIKLCLCTQPKRWDEIEFIWKFLKWIKKFLTRRKESSFSSSFYFLRSSLPKARFLGKHFSCCLEIDKLNFKLFVGAEVKSSIFSFFLRRGKGKRKSFSGQLFNVFAGILRTTSESR